MHRRGLEVVFMIFLGILVATVIGVGVYTFYPFESIYDTALDENYAERRELIADRSVADLTEEEREQLRGIDARRSEIFDALNEYRDGWSRTTSVILISLATLIMAMSLIRSDQLPVISSGLLLGGVLTMVYGLGWTFVSESGVLRFVVLALALVVTLVLGYIRFVRNRSVEAESRVGKSLSGGDKAVTAGDSVDRARDNLAPAGEKLEQHSGDDTLTLADLDQRLRRVEQRIEAMIEALRGEGPE